MPGGDAGGGGSRRRRGTPGPRVPLTLVLCRRRRPADEPMEEEPPL